MAARHQQLTFLEQVKRARWPVWLGVILFLFVLLQLIVVYVSIDIYFEGHHDSSSSLSSGNANTNNNVKNGNKVKKLIEKREITNVNWDNDFESSNFDGGIPYSSYVTSQWNNENVNNMNQRLSIMKKQRIACLVLSLYPRNKILMKTIGDTYSTQCDTLFWILDKSNSYFNVSMHKSVIERGRQYGESFGGISNNNDVINDCDINSNNIELNHLDTIYNGTIILLDLTRDQHHTKRNTWEKVHRLYSYMYVKYLNDFDWFVRIDDDVMVNMLNLRYVLSFYYDGNELNENSNNNNDKHYYIGHTLMDRWGHDNIVYNAGNLHIINQNSLRKLGPFLLTLPTMSSRDAHAHCADFEGGNDDPHFGQCLNFLGIYPINTLDYHFRNRFGIFRWNDHYNILRPKPNEEMTYYWKCRSNLQKEGKNCCHKMEMNDHPWISISNHPHFRYEFKQLSEKWNNEKNFINKMNELKNDDYEKLSIIPSKPRSFLYSIDFNINNKFQIDNPPYGQRLPKMIEGMNTMNAMNNHGSTNGMTPYPCWKCKIGDKSDKYWTNEWDRTMLVFKINDENKEKFWKISKYFPNQLISTQYDIDPNTMQYIANGDEKIEKLNNLIRQALDPNIGPNDIVIE